MKESNKFVIPSKETISLKSEINEMVQKLSKQSNRSKNELVNATLKFALENLEFKEL